MKASICSKAILFAHVKEKKCQVANLHPFPINLHIFSSVARSHFRNTFIFTFAKEQLTWKSFRILATIIDTPLIKRKIY